MHLKTRTRFFASLPGIFTLLLFYGCATPVLSRFEVQRPAQLNVPREVRKVFIRADLVKSDNDRLRLKQRALAYLSGELNRMKRFRVRVVDTLDETMFDPEKESVGLIQGEVISGGEVDRGQFTDIATCTGGLGGRIAAAGAGELSGQALTQDSWRGYVCRTDTFTADLFQEAFTQAFSIAGLEGAPPVNQVVRVHKYRNVTLFSQFSISFTLIGASRETLAIRSDAASFGKNFVDKGSYRHAQEVHNIVVDFLGPLVVHAGAPIFPIPARQAAMALKTNPEMAFFPEGPLPAPTDRDLPGNEKERIVQQLVETSLQSFIRTISPHKVSVGAEVASGGKANAGSLLLEGKAGEARNKIQEIPAGEREADDWYNLGLAFEASALSVDDYEDARRFYIPALDMDPVNRMFAQGVGRTERYLGEARLLSQQVSGK